MNGKQMFFGAAALSLVSFIAPAANSADVPGEESLSPISAEIDGWIGYWFLDDEKGNVVPGADEAFIYGLDGKLRYDVFEGISVQGDFSFDQVEGDGEDFYQGGWIGGGHLSWSNPDNGLLGIFAATGTGESDVNQNADFWLVGAEGQFYGDAWTLYLQAGYFDAKADLTKEDAFHNAWFGRIAARYFFDPSSRLQLEFAYANGDQDIANWNMDILNWGARYDHQLWESITVFAAYDGGYYDGGRGSDSGSYFDHIFRGGLSVSFGRPDLISIDRTGPNLDLPAGARWAASGNSVD